MAGLTTIELRDITRDNWRECTHLQVTASQKDFVASTTYALAMAAYEPNLYPRAIYNGTGTMVGFIMSGWWEEKGAWWIAHVLVDEGYQGYGYGRAALERVLELVKRDHPDAEIGISFIPGNERALALYTALGFRPTGEEGGEEIVLRKLGTEAA